MAQLPSTPIGGSTWSSVVEKIKDSVCSVDAKVSSECVGDSTWSITDNTCCSQSTCYAGDARRQKIDMACATSKQTRATGARDINLGLPTLEQDYELDTGQGRYGRKLLRCIHKASGTPRAVIAMPKSNIPANITGADLENQLELMCKIDHPNVVAFYECCEDQRCLYLVYEWCGGGSFLHELWEHEVVTEGHVAQLARDLLSALEAARSFGVHHLDLSLFAMFLSRQGVLDSVKVFGFGLAGYLQRPVSARGKSDSNKHFFASPEIFRKQDQISRQSAAMQHACDMWSVGALLYTLLWGRPPFKPGPLREYSERVLNERFSFGTESNGYSIAAINLIERTLVTAWDRRLTAREALKHTWVSSTAGASIKIPQLEQTSLCRVTLNQLELHAESSHVERVVARMLQDMGGISSHECMALETKFRALDRNGDGTVSLEELLESASLAKDITEEEIKTIVDSIDRNGNKNIDISEFIAAFALHQEEADERIIKSMFDKMDCDGDARLTDKKFYKILRAYSGSLELAEVTDFITSQDEDGDVHISYPEFRNLFPRCRDYWSEVNAQKDGAEEQIRNAQRCLRKFMRMQQTWVSEVRDHVKKMVKILHNYSHQIVTEYEAQSVISDFHRVLQAAVDRNTIRGRHVRPGAADNDVSGHCQAESIGRTVGKDSQGRLMRKGNRKHSLSSQGSSRSDPSTPAAASRATVLKHAVSTGGRKHGEIPTSPDGGNAPEKSSIVQHCIRKIELQKELNMEDPSYDHAACVFDSLRCLVITKCEQVWQPRVLHALKEAQCSMCEDLHKIVVLKKDDAYTLAEAFNENLIVGETVVLSTGDTLLQGGRLRPLGSINGVELHAGLREKFPDMVGFGQELILFFSTKRPGIQPEDHSHMIAKHAAMLDWAINYAREVIDSVELLVSDVDADMAMSASFESSLPGPPRVSDPYLKYCEGRASAFQRERDDIPFTGNPHNSSWDDDEDSTKPDFADASFSKRLERNSVLRKVSEHRHQTSHEKLSEELPQEGIETSFFLSYAITSTWMP